MVNIAFIGYLDLKDLKTLPAKNTTTTKSAFIHQLLFE